MRAAYLPAWSSFESPEGLARAWELVVPWAPAPGDLLPVAGGLARPPVDLHLARSTAWWLRQVPAELP